MRVWRKTKLLTFLGAYTIILQFLQCIVIAGPARRSSRMIREVYPEIEQEKLEGNHAEVCIVGDVVYGAEEPVPADQPCLKCKCQPPGVQCETTRCLKKPGCRAIHKPNNCCPEYQCECEHEGRFYANGERLETPPGGECRVCYCRGGEVQCAEVSCYIRTDCEGRTVPGQCCPKYDHCPPREPIIDRVVPLPHTTLSSLTSNTNTGTSGYWSSPNASAEDQLTTAVYDIQEITNEDSNKITETQTEPTHSPKVTEMQMLNDSLDDTNKIHIHEMKLVHEATQTDPLDEEMSKQTFVQFKDHSERSTPRNVVVEVKDAPKITIQEIIPEIKEIPITGPPKREINIRTHGQTLDESSESKIINKVDSIDDLDHSSSQEKENIGDLVLGDTESDSSEISEIYHHPPPVLKIGDQLLFLKKGQLVPGSDISTPLPVITIIGAEGLQRGTEDSGETHEIISQVQEPQRDLILQDTQHNETDTTEGNENSSTASTHIVSFVKSKGRTDDTTKTSLSTIEDFLLNLTKIQPTTGDDVYLDNLDANTTIMTENIINKIKTLANVESTTDVAHLIQKVFISDVNSTDTDFNNENSTVNPTNEQNTTTTDEKWYEVQPTTKDSAEEDNSSTSAEPVTLLERLESVFMSLSTEETEKEGNTTHSPAIQVTSDSSTSSRYEELGEATKLKHDEESIPVDQNPEYPPIPDIMSPQNVDELSEHLDSELALVSSEEPLIAQENSTFNTSFITEIVSDIAESSSLSPEVSIKDSGVIFKILPGIPTEGNNQTLSDDRNMRNETNRTSHPIINEKAALPTTLLKQIAPTDHLVDEDETEKNLKDEIKASSKELQPVIDSNNFTQNHITQISQKNASLEVSTINASTEVLSTESDRSKETLEESSTEDSGESTTPKNRHASVILSVEDASVETINNGSPEMDTTDLVETIPGIEKSTEETENKAIERKYDITTISTLSSIEKDAELINPQVLMGNLKPKENLAVANSSKENKVDIKDKKTKTSKETVSKLKNTKMESRDKETEDIFKQLNEELKTVPSSIIDNKTGDEDAQAEAIFRELLEEATSSTLLPDSNTQGEGFVQPREKESALLQRVSEAITKFQMKESKESLDASILGILRDFFSSQYKYYDTKK